MPDRRFPHMMPEDIPVWERWLTTHVNDWSSVQYDVHVGEGVTLPTDFGEPFLSNAMHLSQKRIDVVLFYTDRVVIIEVKALAGWKSIGQMVGYPLLYAEAFPSNIDIKTLLVTEAFTLDTQHIMDLIGMPYDIVPNPNQSDAHVEPPPTEAA